MRKTLIIGYGNTLRSDDGVGVRVAEKLALNNYPSLTIITSQQLTPELALEITAAERVIFVDAALGEKEVRVEAIQPKLGKDWATHTSNPEALLALTQTLYGQVPSAWWVLIPVYNLELGEDLSELTQVHQQTAMDLILELINY